MVNILDPASNHKSGYRRHVFGDTVLCIPERYVHVEPRGVGAQGIVWWVKQESDRVQCRGNPIFLLERKKKVHDIFLPGSYLVFSLSVKGNPNLWIAERKKGFRVRKRFRINKLRTSLLFIFSNKNKLRLFWMLFLIFLAYVHWFGNRFNGSCMQIGIVDILEPLKCCDPCRLFHEVIYSLQYL